MYWHVTEMHWFWSIVYQLSRSVSLPLLQSKTTSYRWRMCRYVSNDLMPLPTSAIYRILISTQCCARDAERFARALTGFADEREFVNVTTQLNTRGTLVTEKNVKAFLCSKNTLFQTFLRSCCIASLLGSGDKFFFSRSISHSIGISSIFVLGENLFPF